MQGDERGGSARIVTHPGESNVANYTFFVTVFIDIERAPDRLRIATGARVQNKRVRNDSQLLKWEDDADTGKLRHSQPFSTPLEGE